MLTLVPSTVLNPPEGPMIRPSSLGPRTIEPPGMGPAADPSAT
jgi:hypothetical protein